ncbi:MAG: sensor histidine kinase N-terminal domain-containing protein [Burkholderiales bacterium]|nr:sensor histidine kinase N-terminal domain-containing protein [Burkholderiales bacterium]
MRLRSLLLAWLLVPSLALWGLAFAFGYLHSLGQAHEAFDRTLLGSALVLGERLQLQDGEVVADLPPAALEMLRTDAHDRVFYRVVDVRSGRHITGYADLPDPPQASASAPSVPRFYDGEHQGQAVRIVALTVDLLDGERSRPLQVQVAETQEARRELTRRQVLEAAAVQLALIGLAAALIALGVRRGLAPLKRLRAEVRARGADDLQPIATRDVPREVAPLIQAINTQMLRQRQLSELQLRFVANASHQLKTPLTLLRAQIDHALQQSALPAMRGVLEQIHQSALGTQRLVSQLLSLARSDPSLALAKEPLDLVALAREVTFEMLTHSRARGIDLGFEGEGRITVTAEHVLLREAIANLVHNAITYTHAAAVSDAARADADGASRGGLVTVRVQAGEGGSPCLSVCDNGPGIPPDERARVLERFYRRPGAGGSGSGLGLSIVKEICERHDIELTLQDGADGLGLCVLMRWRG